VWTGSIGGLPHSRLPALLPWHWKAARQKQGRLTAAPTG
jgi:hypothetical protein